MICGRVLPRKNGDHPLNIFGGNSKKEECEKTNKVYYLPVAKARILPKTYKIIKQINHLLILYMFTVFMQDVN